MPTKQLTTDISRPRNGRIALGGKNPKVDYHQNINAEAFMDWVNHRLFPSFFKRYPEKNPILILDNASYHWGRDDEFINFKYQDPTSNRSRLVYFYVSEIRAPVFVYKRGKETISLKVKRKQMVTFFDKQRNKRRAVVTGDLNKDVWDLGSRKWGSIQTG